MITKQAFTIINSSSKPPVLIHLINKCKNMRQLKQIHAHIIKQANFNLCPLLKLISFCTVSPRGNVAYAKTIFDHHQDPSVEIYNTLIRGLSSTKLPLEALRLYQKLLRSGLRPNNFTYPFVIKACTESSMIQYGVLIHPQIIKSGLESDPYIQSSLIHFYVTRKDLHAAQQLFDLCSETDLVSWNSMIDGYVKFGQIELAQQVFDRMVIRDVISWNTMINGYGILGRIEDAKRLFDEMPVRSIVSWNSMLAGYDKCGNVEDAFNMFTKMPYKDVVSWNTMLACYAHSGKSNEALSLFDEMQALGIKPNEATMVSLLSACGHLGALEQGLCLHSYLSYHKIKTNSIVGTALVDMYAKCGSISRATEVFHSLESKDVLAWNTIITGMAMHGSTKDTIQLFEKMQREGVAPNDITFVALLGACRHAGMVEEGQRLLVCMSRTYGIAPKIEHYGCVIDLLARAGRLEEAMELIGTMPMEPNASAWGALLGGCRIYGNAQVGERVGKHLINLQPHHSGRYILLSNVYAAAERWDDASKVRNLMKVKGVSKVPGVSVIELKGIIHRFVAGDWSHPESHNIYEKLGQISTRLKTTSGYSPDTDQVLVDIEDEEKEHLLSVHSEKLAIAYGFLHLDPKEAIRIVKNLRVCRDCHYVIKLISRIYVREIIVRDRNRFHHFKDGRCSCLDFW
ncbi:pentatricopeptide repeat-containing protein At1g08070, chloroplastic-like isoform X1 [Actinidia eriantha]|uniref:pentatricopeptide repeat-containing protein At1g08070, chloroplastic-like isoform X1 n=1 Tax=Actinidia eriantha TaxID=165200 RepID=UPI00258804FE|nr:pentatricopeptide repeat-containing protein At1g08070, chloroplastic-like isoform X1 [Actinidia eriantha]